MPIQEELFGKTPEGDEIHVFTGDGNDKVTTTTNVYIPQIMDGGTHYFMLFLQNNTAPFGYRLERANGTFNLFRGASGIAAGSTCTTANPETGNCRSVLDANSNEGGGGSAAAIGCRRTPSEPRST